MSFNVVMDLAFLQDGFVMDLQIVMIILMKTFVTRIQIFMIFTNANKLLFVSQNEIDQRCYNNKSSSGDIFLVCIESHPASKYVGGLSKK